jgi:hypothetical protein
VRNCFFVLVIVWKHLSFAIHVGCLHAPSHFTGGIYAAGFTNDPTADPWNDDAKVPAVVEIGDFALFEHNVGDGRSIGDGGAATIDYYSSMKIGDYAVLRNNSALAVGSDGFGGAFYISYGCTFQGGSHILFESNKAVNLAFSLSQGISWGGGISFYKSTAAFGSNITFINNQAQYSAGGLHIWSARVKMGDDLTFIRNRAIGWYRRENRFFNAYGGAMWVSFER